jgi:hypothetical protein
VAQLDCLLQSVACKGDIKSEAHSLNSLREACKAVGGVDGWEACRVRDAGKPPLCAALAAYLAANATDKEHEISLYDPNLTMGAAEATTISAIMAKARSTAILSDEVIGGLK